MRGLCVFELAGAIGKRVSLALQSGEAQIRRPHLPSNSHSRNRNAWNPLQHSPAALNGPF